MNQVKIIFSDMDGTLLNTYGKLSEKTIQSVRQISQRGIPFILASARAPKEMIEAVRQLDLKTPLVSYNGGIIYKYNSSGDLQILDSVPLERKEMQSIYLEIQERFPDVSLTVYSENTWYAQRYDEGVQAEIQLTGCKPVLADFNNLILKSDHTFHKIMIMGDESTLNQLENELRKHLFSNTAIYRSSLNYLEITHVMANKLTAVKKIAKYYHFTKEEIMTIGDNYNDLAMIEYAGIGVAVKNAPKEIQHVANLITETNDNNGVAYALMNYIN
ncbi:HAD family hydrolase [Sporolactobacillus sp. STCC-11]|uniref:HAD family hydrolase n=1 Tax=Sporolactobacillus caesalpiniae TaxID=3230362 RepID=UPI003394BF11